MEALGLAGLAASALGGFGGGGKSKSQQQSQQQSQSQSQATSTMVDTTPPELRALRSPLVDQLMSVFGQIGQAPGNPIGTSGNILGQPLYSPMAPGEAAALPGVNAIATDPTRAGLINSTLSGNFLPGQPGANPFLDAAVKAAVTQAQQPTIDAYNQNVSKVLPSMFAAAGHQVDPTSGSSAFTQALTDASKTFGQTLANQAQAISAPAYAAAYESERGRQQAAIPLGQQEINTAISNLQAQGLPRLIQDLGPQRALQVWQTQVQSLIQALAVAGGAPIANQGQNSQSTSSSTSSGTSTGVSNTTQNPNLNQALTGSGGFLPWAFPQGFA